MQTAQKNEHRYTYSDYCTWDGEKRCELIGGVAYAMSPGASFTHQSVVVAILTQLGNYLQDKPCKVFTAPFDVRLNADADDDTVVQPDVLVVCDPSKFDTKGIVGAPDLIVEVLSPSTEKHDRNTKFRLYQRFGVREYWIVDPSNETASINILNSGRYVTHLHFKEDAVPVHVLDGCIMDLSKVFV